MKPSVVVLAAVVVVHSGRPFSFFLALPARE